MGLIIAQWSCEIPSEFFNDFINYSKEKLKLYYESHGCEKYSLFLPVEKVYFSYQEVQNKTRYTEEFQFKSIEDYEKFLKDHETNPISNEITSVYRRKYKAHSCIIRIFEKKFSS